MSVLPLSYLRSAMRMILAGRFAGLWYQLSWRVRGLDLYPVTSVETLGLSPENANVFSDTGGPALAEVLSVLPVRPDDVALDVGSGKGGACITMARFPFSEVVGIEGSHPLW